MKLYKHGCNEYYLLNENEEIISIGSPEHVSDILSQHLSQYLISSGHAQDIALEQVHNEIDLAISMMQRMNHTVSHFGKHSFLFSE